MKKPKNENVNRNQSWNLHLLRLKRQQQKEHLLQYLEQKGSRYQNEWGSPCHWGRLQLQQMQGDDQEQEWKKLKKKPGEEWGLWESQACSGVAQIEGVAGKKAAKEETEQVVEPKTVVAEAGQNEKETEEAPEGLVVAECVVVEQIGENVDVVVEEWKVWCVVEEVRQKSVEPVHVQREEGRVCVQISRTRGSFFERRSSSKRCPGGDEDHRP